MLLVERSMRADCASGSGALLQPRPWSWRKWCRGRGEEQVKLGIGHYSTVLGALRCPLIEKEIRDAIFDMEHNKAGFPAEFYQQFWLVIKWDQMRMFHDLHKGDLPLFSLNFGIITLLPKQKKPAKSSNTDRFAYLMWALRSLWKWRQSISTRSQST